MNANDQTEIIATPAGEHLRARDLPKRPTSRPLGLVKWSTIAPSQGIRPYQHSDPAARGNMWPGLQWVRRRTWGNRKKCCRCRHIGTVGRPFRSGARDPLLLLLHRGASPFRADAFRPDSPLASQLAFRQSSPMHRCTWCTHAQCGLSSSVGFPAALSFSRPLVVEVRYDYRWSCKLCQKHQKYHGNVNLFPWQINFL